jgi:hypothetical protein
MGATGKIIAGILALPIILAVGYFYTQREPHKSRFYVDDDLESDVWEIPIIEPYRLITADSRRGSQAGHSRWDFQGKNMAASFRPDSLSYQKGFITFHTPDAHQYGFYDLKHDKTTFLSSYQQFNDFAKFNGLENTLYNTEDVYSCWQQTRQLPWAKEIFVQNYGSTISN